MSDQNSGEGKPPSTAGPGKGLIRIGPSLDSAWSRIADRPALSAAAVCLVVAILLAIFNRVAAGSLAAALFVVLVLLERLPQMESFRAWGVEAKLRARLDEADDILRKLKQATLASAELSYHILGWGSRMGGRVQKAKQRIADQVDAALIELGVDKRELSNLKHDYLFFATYDLFQRFDDIVNMNLEGTIRRMNDRGVQINDDSNAEAIKLRDQLAQLQRFRGHGDAMKAAQADNFREFCHSRIAKSILPKKHVAILVKFADRVADLVENMKETGRVSDEMADLIDSRKPEELKVLYRKLFKTDPTKE